jgi:hypothetical protein
MIEFKFDFILFLNSKLYKKKENKMELLKFQKGNAKLDKNIMLFSLIAGHACPFAKDCLSKVNFKTGKLEDGPDTQFRCFSASSEALFPKVFEARKHNWDLLRKLRSVDSMAELIHKSLPAKAKIVRVHVSGDFFNQTYFDAWMQVARMNPQTIFYAYTKSVPYWVERINEIPENFSLTASKGGRNDNMIENYNLKYAEVVFSEEEAKEKGFQIDHDDSLAIYSKKSFALLLHGGQPAGSVASKALSALRKEGKGGYSKKKKKETVTVK